MKEKIEQVEQYLKGLAPLFLAVAVASQRENAPSYTMDYSVGEKYALPEGLEWKDFIVKFFNQLNSKYSTCSGEEVETFTDKFRSIGDIYRILINYYPDVKLYDLYQYLVDLCRTEELHSWICKNIMKRTYVAKERFSYFDGGRGFSSEKIDEFGVDFSVFNGINECKTQAVMKGGAWGYGYGVDHTREQLSMVTI